MEKRHYSLKLIIESLPKEKISADSYWTRFILRPVSFPVAWICLELGFSANATSWLSAIISIIGGALLATGQQSFGWLGIVFLFLFSILDCADGNIARTVKKENPWGSWTDAMGGYIAYTATLLGLGMAAEVSSGASLPGISDFILPWDHGTWIFLGGFAAATNMLMRAAVQSHRSVNIAKTIDLGKKANIDSPPPGREKRLSENLGVTGIMIPAIALGYAAKILPWILLFYVALYGLGSVVVIVKLAMSTTKGEKT